MPTTPNHESGQHPESTQDEDIIAREVDRYMESKKKETVDPISAQIRDLLEFRLMGFDMSGKRIGWKEDLKPVVEVERKLIIDPAELKSEFAQIRGYRCSLEQQGDLSEEQIEEKVRDFSLHNARFSTEGGHLGLNKEETLFRVRREGWVIQAGILDARKKFHTLAYNYGLTSMPEDDWEFLLLSKSTINAHERDKEDMNTERISFNWRTGVAKTINASILDSTGVKVPMGLREVSLRRIGLASALKYIITRLAELHNKESMYFNIGDLHDVQPGSKERIRNAPSYFHNIRYFKEAMGYRSVNSEVVENGEEIGTRNKAAKVSWKVHRDRVSRAVENLRSQSSILVKRGHDMQKLEQAAVRIAEQLHTEQ